MVFSGVVNCIYAVLLACRRLCLSSLFLLLIGPPVAPNCGIGLLCQRKGKMADVSPRRRAFPGHSPFNGGRILQGGEGSFQFVWRTDLELDLERKTKLLRGVIRPISTPNDYLNTVFDDVVSLRGSCRNHAFPRSPREKLQLVAIFSQREKSLSSQERNMLIV